MGAVRREQKLRQVVGADRQEVEARQQQVEHFGQGRHLQHRAIFDRDRQLLLMAVQPFALMLDQSTGGFIFPRLRHHREHDVEYLARARLQQRARLCFHQPVAIKRKAERAPAHGGIVLQLLVAIPLHIGQRLVAADIDGAENDWPVARRVQHILVKPLLLFALRQGRGHQELELGAEQADAIRADQVQRLRVFAQARIDHQFDALPIGGHGRQVAHGREFRATLLRHMQLILERLVHVRAGPDQDGVFGHVQQDEVAFIELVADIPHPAKNRHAHGARDDGDMGRQRPFLQDHTLQPPAIIFQQLRRPQIARDQYGILAQAQLRSGAQLPRHDAKQPVRHILQIVHPILQQRVVNLPHAHAGALLHPLDGRFGGQATVDRFIDPPDPPLVIGEHLVGFEHLLMFALGPEFGRAGHPVDLLAHFRKGGNDPRAFGLGIFGHRMFDMDARLVKDGVAARHAHHQLQALQDGRARFRNACVGRAVIGQFGVGDQFGQHHGDRLQRLDLHLFIAARLHMLHAQDADRPLPPHDRDAGKAVKAIFPGFGTIGKVGMRRRLVQVQRLDIGGDKAHQPLPHGHPRDVDGLLLEAACGEQFQHAFAHQIDGADLAGERLANDLHHLVELRLGAVARRHHLLQQDKDLAGGGGGRRGHRAALPD